MRQRGRFSSRRSRHLFAEPYGRSWRCRISVRVLVALSIAAAIAVFLDARPRLGAARAAAWAAAALAAAVVAVPAYLLTRPSRAPAWGASEIVGLTLFFAGTIPAIATVLGRGGQAELPPLPVIGALAVFQDALFAGGSLYVARVKYRLPLAALGLTVGRWSRALGQGAVAAAAAIAGNNLGQSATVFVLGLWMGGRAANALVQRDELHTPAFRVLALVHQPAQLAALAVLVGVVVPIGEELFFRGLVFGALRRRLNRHLAAVLSALFFTAAHLDPAATLPILLLGLVLAYTYEYTGSLVPGMVAHGVNNLAALLVFYQGPPG